MSDISAVISKRLLRVAKKIEEIAAGRKPATASAKPAAKKPVAAASRPGSRPAAKPTAKPASTQRTALDNPKDKGSALSVEKMNPVVNLIDDKAKALDKMLNAFLSALDKKNESSAKSMLKTIVKKIEELEAASAKHFKPLTASAASDKKKAIERTLRRAKALSSRHGGKLGVK